MNSLGVESPSPLNRSYTSISTSAYSTPGSTPVNRAISRVALQPPTPVVVPPSPSPAAGAGSSSTMNGHSNGGGSAHGNGSSRLAIGSTSGSSSGLSPSTSSQDLVSDAEEAERQTNRRSMYRSPGTSSSPDLATLLRKAKERGGSGPGGAGGSGAASGSGSNGMGQGRRERRRDDPHPPLPDQTLRGHPTSHSHSSATLVASPSAYPSDMATGIERSPDWILASPKQQKENGTIRVCIGGMLVLEC